MKLWSATTNNGDWGGMEGHYCIAETQEEADNKMNLPSYRNRNYDVYGPVEVTGNALLRKLVGSDAEGYEMSYTLADRQKGDS